MSTLKKSAGPKHHCSSTELKILGDYWTLVIIQSLNDGEKRFGELEKSIQDINPTTLTNRLKKLEAQRIVSRKEETLNKLSVVYSLTQKGQAIMPVLREIKLFAKKYLT